MLRQTRQATQEDIQSLVAYYIDNRKFSPEQIFYHLRDKPVRGVDFSSVAQQVSDAVYFGRQSATIEPTQSVQPNILSNYETLVAELSNCTNIRQVRKLLADFNAQA